MKWETMNKEKEVKKVLDKTELMLQVIDEAHKIVALGGGNIQFVPAPDGDYEQE